MYKLLKFIALASQSIFLQFVHLFGLVAFGASAAVGYFRLPSWIVPIVAVVFGVIADKYVDESEVVGLLEKAHDADKRGGFLILIYFVICAVGYVAGAYGRHYAGKGGASIAVPGKK
jgi:hypothetical protein